MLLLEVLIDLLPSWIEMWVERGVDPRPLLIAIKYNNKYNRLFITRGLFNIYNNTKLIPTAIGGTTMTITDAIDLVATASLSFNRINPRLTNILKAWIITRVASEGNIKDRQKVTQLWSFDEVIALDIKPQCIYSVYNLYDVPWPHRRLAL